MLILAFKYCSCVSFFIEHVGGDNALEYSAVERVWFRSLHFTPSATAPDKEAAFRDAYTRCWLHLLFYFPRMNMQLLRSQTAKNSDFLAESESKSSVHG